MKKFSIGKAHSNNDFTRDMLPHTRREVFFDVLKNNWSKFTVFGLLLLLFCIPLHYISVREVIVVNDMYLDFDTLSPSEQNEIMNKVITLKNTFALFKIPCFMLIFAALAGFSRIIRQYAWEENVLFSTDFITGIKENATPMLALGFITGIMNTVCVVSYNLSAFTPDILSGAMLLFPTVIALLLGIPILAYSLVCIPIYKNSIFGTLKMALGLFFSKPLKTYLALICCAVPFIPQFTNNIVFILSGRVLSTILYPTVLLGWFLFSYDILDERVNKQRHPELVGRGTFPEEILESDITPS